MKLIRKWSKCAHQDAKRPFSKFKPYTEWRRSVGAWMPTHCLFLLIGADMKAGGVQNLLSFVEPNKEKRQKSSSIFGTVSGLKVKPWNKSCLSLSLCDIFDRLTLRICAFYYGKLLGSIEEQIWPKLKAEFYTSISSSCFKCFWLHERLKLKL